MPSRLKQPGNRGDAYFLDASVVMYAVGGDHPLRGPSRDALKSAVERRCRLVTDSEVLQELLHRYFSIRRPDIARTAYHSTVRLCEEIIAVTEADTAGALDLLLRMPDLTSRDAIHASVMGRAGIRFLLSTDRHFDSIPGIRRIAPADFVLG